MKTNTKTSTVKSTPVAKKVTATKVSKKVAVKKVSNQTKLELAMAKRVLAREASISNAYDNDVFLDTLAARSHREKNIETLKGMYTTLEQIPSEKLPTIGDIKVTPYAVMSNNFGEEIGLILGLVTSLSTLFIDSQKEIEFSMINTTSSEVEDLQNSLGRPAYFSKKYVTVEDAITGDYELAKRTLEMFSESIGLVPVDFSRFTELTYKLWFADSEKKARLKLDQINKFEMIQSDERATMLVITD